MHPYTYIFLFSKILYQTPYRSDEQPVACQTSWCSLHVNSAKKKKIDVSKECSASIFTIKE
jgi:hypothetical protein